MQAAFFYHLINIKPETEQMLSSPPATHLAQNFIISLIFAMDKVLYRRRQHATAHVPETPFRMRRPDNNNGALKYGQQLQTAIEIY